MTLLVDRADNFLNQDGECLIVTSLGDIIIFPRRERSRVLRMVASPLLSRKPNTALDNGQN